jgi:hypothetical protein|tara:strand:- start:45 stop:521 length:477 start_codon:yes stop_codon:yes gene_type:complete
MTKRNKQALAVLIISIPSFGLGVWQFEIGGAASSFVAMSTSIAVTLGAAGIIAGVTMLFTKNRLGWFDGKPLSDKPIFIKKEKREMTKIKKEEPVAEETIIKDGSESLGLMKREKSLLKRQEELSALVTELETELNQVRESLEIKGWIQSADNGWVIE